MNEMAFDLYLRFKNWICPEVGHDLIEYSLLVAVIAFATTCAAFSGQFGSSLR